LIKRIKSYDPPRIHISINLTNSRYLKETQFNQKQIQDELKVNVIDKLELWISHCKSKLRKIGSKLELEVCLIRYYELFQQIIKSENSENKDSFGNVLIFLQEKIKPLTNDTEILFESSRMIITNPTKVEIELKISDLLKNIKKTFYKVFFVVEGYNRNFILESVLSVIITSLESKHVKVTDANQ
jgi:hypothetical protein